MDDEVIIEWKSNLKFRYELSDQSILLDALFEKGGEEEGISPKHLLLVSLAGCTGMDVAAILRNLDYHPESFKIQVSGSQREVQEVYRSIHIDYQFIGKDEFKNKVIKAVKSSMNRYCSIGKMLQGGVLISWEINYNHVRISDSRW